MKKKVKKNVALLLLGVLLCGGAFGAETTSAHTHQYNIVNTFYT